MSSYCHQNTVITLYGCGTESQKICICHRHYALLWLENLHVHVLFVVLEAWILGSWTLRLGWAGRIAQLRCWVTSEPLHFSWRGGSYVDSLKKQK